MCLSVSCQYSCQCESVAVQASESVQALKGSQQQTLKDCKALQKMLAARPLAPTATFTAADNSEIQLHSLDGIEGSSAMIKLRTQWLSKAHPKSVHIVLSQSSNQVICVLGKKCKGQNAVEVLSQMLSEIEDGTEQPGKCGGSAGFAQGHLGQRTLKQVKGWLGQTQV